MCWTHESQSLNFATNKQPLHDETIFVKKGTPVKVFSCECWETFRAYYTVFMDYYFSFTLLRSSRSQIFFKKSFFKKFAIFTEKHLSWNLFLINKVSCTKKVEHEWKGWTWMTITEKEDWSWKWRLNCRKIPILFAKFLF